MLRTAGNTTTRPHPWSRPHREQPDRAPTLPRFVGLDYSRNAGPVCILDFAGMVLGNHDCPEAAWASRRRRGLVLSSLEGRRAPQRIGCEDNPPSCDILPLRSADAFRADVVIDREAGESQGCTLVRIESSAKIGVEVEAFALAPQSVAAR